MDDPQGPSLLEETDECRNVIDKSRRKPGMNQVVEGLIYLHCSSRVQHSRQVLASLRSPSAQTKSRRPEDGP